MVPPSQDASAEGPLLPLADVGRAEPGSAPAGATADSGTCSIEHLRVLVQDLHLACHALHADALCLVEGPGPEEAPDDWAERVRASAAVTAQRLHEYWQQLGLVVQLQSPPVRDP